MISRLRNATQYDNTRDKLIRIAALHSWSLASVGIIFLRRTKTPTFLLSCLHISLTCFLNLGLSSNVTPSNLRSGVDLMVYPSMFTFMRACRCCSLYLSALHCTCHSFPSGNFSHTIWILFVPHH